MISAVESYLRDWATLFYWVFFKPKALRAHVREIAPDQAAERVTVIEFLRICTTDPALRGFLIKALVYTTFTALLLIALVALISVAFGGEFDLQRALANLALGLALGVAFGLAFGVAFGVAFGLALGLALGMAFGVASGVAFGVAFGVTSGVAGGVALGLALGLALAVEFGVASGVAVGVAVGVASSVAFGVAFGVTSGVTFGVTVGVAGVLGAMRLPFYVFELLPAVLAYRRSARGGTPERELRRSPAYFDDLLVLPQPFLAALLLRVARGDLASGLRQLGEVGSNPFQRWAARRVLRRLLEQDGVPFFVILDRLLAAPARYVQTGIGTREDWRADDRYFTTRLLLGELMDRWPKAAVWIWPNDYLARTMTWPLRRCGASPYAGLAAIYLDLLERRPGLEAQLPAEGVESGPGQTEQEASSLAIVLPEEARQLPHGEEFYQSLRLAGATLRCRSLQDIARFKDELTPLSAIVDTLRPTIIAVYRHLGEAAIDATSFLTAVHGITQHNALLKAQGALEVARQLCNTVYEPERSILLYAIERWRRIFVVGRERLVSKVEVTVLPNPYVAGRPIRREDGKLFVGRRDEFRRIEETLQTGVSVVIYGQRRIGKTSILLHLDEHMTHDWRPLYINLQRSMAETTGGFLHAVAKAIVSQLQKAQLNAPLLPPCERFQEEPFLTLDHLIKDIEFRLPADYRITLVFDEVEELETSVNEGRLDRRIFSFLRGLTQSGSKILLVFAGLHTLEQMTHDYWHPFFASVKLIKIGYLAESDAWQLISDPIDDFPLEYDREAIQRITAVTRSHPFLIQDLCFNVVTRLNDPLYRRNRVAVEDVDAVIEKTLETGAYYFDEYVWGRSTQDERLVLSLVAEASGWAGFSVLEGYLESKAALAATKSLVARDILTETTEGGELVFRFQIPLSSIWVRRQKSSTRTVLERRSG